MKLTSVEPISVVVGDAGCKPIGVATYIRYRHWRMECKLCGWMGEGEVDGGAAAVRLLTHLTARHA